MCSVSIIITSMNHRYIYILLFLIAIFFHSTADAANPIRIVGSSTVYPFAASVAEHFGKTGDFRTPVVEATGTGAGFKLFCGGSETTHITNASRAILPVERAQCAQ